MKILSTLGPTRDLGQKYEQKALAYLIDQGLKPVTQNFNCKTGEIDLIMLDSRVIVFVEVRYRKSTHFMSVAETITYFKQEKLRRTAEFFLSYHLKRFKLSNYLESRFDVVTIENIENIENINAHLKISWIKNAF